MYIYIYIRMCIYIYIYIYVFCSAPARGDPFTFVRTRWFGLCSGEAWVSDRHQCLAGAWHALKQKKGQLKGVYIYRLPPLSPSSKTG